MTLKNGFGKCSLFGLSANGWKDQKHDLFVFPPKKIKSCCSMTSKRSIGWFLEILGHEVFSLISSVRLKNQPKATQVCIRSINQSNLSISVHLFFLCCSRVLFSRSYENRSSRSFFLMLVPKRNSIRPRLQGSGQMFERTNFLTYATGLQGNVQILLQNCLHKSVQIFLSVSIEFFLFLPRRVTGSRIVSCKLYKKPTWSSC